MRESVDGGEPGRSNVASADLLPAWGHLVILGMTGSGKTALNRILLQGRTRVLVVDPKEEYVRECVQVTTGEELAAVVQASPGRWRIAYYNRHLEDDFPALALAATELGRVTFVVEETDWYCSPSFIDPALADLLKYGRPRYGQPNTGVEVWCVSRRPGELNRLCTSQAMGVFCFQTCEARDKQYLVENVGSDFAADLCELPVFNEAEPQTTFSVCKQYLRRAGAGVRYWKVHPPTGVLTSVERPMVQSE